MNVCLAAPVTKALEILEHEGYEAYVVGGAIRDLLRCKTPGDWDLATNAAPERVRELFAAHPQVDIGVRHGTLGVAIDRMMVEITTYRAEGTYEDARRPSEVHFIGSIEQDLARRDFTINAIAYHPVRGLVDPFSGRTDLENGILRAVGDAGARFAEDPLRVLRGLRLRATLGFSWHEATRLAAIQNRAALAFVSKERVHRELKRMLTGDYIGLPLREDTEILFAVLPELAPLQGFLQHNPHHRFDVYEHTVRVVENTGADYILRFSALFHDSGKPDTFTMDDKGIGHFYGHGKVSETLAREVLLRLHEKKATMNQILRLVRLHDIYIFESKEMLRKRLSLLGEDLLRKLICLKRADAIGQGTKEHMLHQFGEMEQALDAMLEREHRMGLADLAIDGHDVKTLGLRGAEIGRALKMALQYVLDDPAKNEKDLLLRFLTEQRDAHGIL